MSAAALCGCPWRLLARSARCFALTTKLLWRCVASQYGAARWGSGARGCPRAGSGRTARRGAVPSDTSRVAPTTSPTTLPVGASTGALPLAVVDAIPGDLEGPRAGAHGCATFLSLVSLSSKAPAFATLLRALVAVLALRVPAAATRNPNATTLKVIAPLLTHIPSCQLSAAESHCLQRWTKRLTNSNHSTK